MQKIETVNRINGEAHGEACGSESEVMLLILCYDRNTMDK